MGRILVLLLLGTTVFGALTVLIGVVHVVWDLVILLDLVFKYSVVANPPGLPPTLAFTGIWFQFALYYFFIVIPVGIGILLVWHFLVRKPILPLEEAKGRGLDSTEGYGVAHRVRRREGDRFVSG